MDTGVLDLRQVKWGDWRHGAISGVFPKEKVGKKYYKLSAFSPDVGIYGIQSISEVIASRVAKIIGVDCVEYRLVPAVVRLNNQEFETILCESDDYNHRDEGILVFEDLYSSRIRVKGEISPLDFAKEIGIHDEVYRMFVLDYLINNIDRHGRNVEILVDERGKMRFAPLFDHGLSLFSSKGDEDLVDSLDSDHTLSNSFVGSPNLRDNLDLIDRPIRFRRLNLSHREVIFEGVEEYISSERIEFIWRCLLRRYGVLREYETILCVTI